MKEYPITHRVQSQIDKTFVYHPPHADQPMRYVAIREKARELALLIARSSPESREQSNALTRLEEAVAHANAAIARNEPLQPGVGS